MHFFKRSILVACSIMVLFSLNGQAEPKTKSSPWASVSILEPIDGATVTSPVTVKFDIRGMALIPAGIEHPESGHHHLLIDLAELPDLDKPIPADDQHLHFGKGQRETSLTLAPGVHTLQLLLGDHLHRPHDPAVYSKKITITVKENKAQKK